MTDAFQNLQLRQALVPKDKVATLPETNVFAPENWCLEDYFPFWDTIFSGAMLVSG